MCAKIVLTITAFVLAISISGIVVLKQNLEKEKGGNVVHRQQNNESSEEIGNKVLAQKQVQAEIDRIMNDDTVDISDWPTFTNTAYGWSIKVHPEGHWASNSPQHAPETAPGPSYWIGNNKLVRIDSHRNSEGLSIADFMEGRAEVEINDSIYAVDWNELLFITLSIDNNFIYKININQQRKDDLRNPLIRSLQTFTLSK